MTAISDFNDTEMWTIQTTLDERWGNDKLMAHLADVETKLKPGDAEPVSCPAAFWRTQADFESVCTGAYQPSNKK